MSADKDTLVALLERVRAATGADRELDEAVAYATKFRPDAAHDRLESFACHEAKHDYGAAWIAHQPWRAQWGIPNYTASVDAALALTERVLPGWTVAQLGQQDDKSWWCELREGYLTSYSRIARSETSIGKRSANLPLAIIAALLSALIAQPQPTGMDQ